MAEYINLNDKQNSKLKWRPITTQDFPLKRSKTFRACTRCRVKKSKCDGIEPRCSRCERDGALCEYVKLSKRKHSPNNDLNQTSHFQASLAPFPPSILQEQESPEERPDVERLEDEIRSLREEIRRLKLERPSAENSSDNVRRNENSSNVEPGLDSNESEQGISVNGTIVRASALLRPPPVKANLDLQSTKTQINKANYRRKINPFFYALLDLQCAQLALKHVDSKSNDGITGVIPGGPWLGAFNFTLARRTVWADLIKPGLRAEAKVVSVDDSAAQELVRIYLLFSHFIFPLVDTRSLASQAEKPLHPLVLSALYSCSLLFAAVPGQESRLRRAADAFFQLTRLKIYNAITSDGSSIAVVQAYALMSFNTGHQQQLAKSLLYRSMAISLAQSLELHRQDGAGYEGLVGEDREVVKRIWWSLVCLDIMQSMLLARPALIDLDEMDVELPEVPPGESVEHHLLASFRLWVIGHLRMRRLVQIINRHQEQQLSAKAFNEVERNAREYEEMIPSRPSSSWPDNVQAYAIFLRLISCQLWLIADQIWMAKPPFQGPFSPETHCASRRALIDTDRTVNLVEELLDRFPDYVPFNTTIFTLCVAIQIAITMLQHTNEEVSKEAFRLVRRIRSIIARMSNGQLCVWLVKELDEWMERYARELHIQQLQCQRVEAEDTSIYAGNWESPQPISQSISLAMLSDSGTTVKPISTAPNMNASSVNTPGIKAEGMSLWSYMMNQQNSPHSPPSVLGSNNMTPLLNANSEIDQFREVSWMTSASSSCTTDKSTTAGTSGVFAVAAPGSTPGITANDEMVAEPFLELLQENPSSLSLSLTMSSSPLTTTNSSTSENAAMLVNNKYEQMIAEESGGRNGKSEFEKSRGREFFLSWNSEGGFFPPSDVI
ncbi:uncharacterized protein VTP21DRAFT_4329 [Calcarisporiella thermophila]|uniref:uncharacterized protein n=1 Tax=Calcarisporiella thermophila TaxID=911321 RepID=UPI003743EF4D